MFLLFWIILLLAFKITGTSCWFYSDYYNEWSFSENFSVLLYFLSGSLLYLKGKKFIPLFLIFLGLEEANYFQHFWAPMNMLPDENQFALHTQTNIENQLYLLDIVLIFLGIILPLYYYKVKNIIFIQPLLMSILTIILIPVGTGVSNYWFQSCGLDSTEEVAEVLLPLFILFYTYKFYYTKKYLY